MHETNKGVDTRAIVIRYVVCVLSLSILANELQAESDGDPQEELVNNSLGQRVYRNVAMDLVNTLNPHMHPWGPDYGYQSDYKSLAVCLAWDDDEQVGLCGLEESEDSKRIPDYFAISRLELIQAYGFAFNHKSEDEAVSRALGYCQEKLTPARLDNCECTTILVGANPMTQAWIPERLVERAIAEAVSKGEESDLCFDTLVE